MYCAPPQRRSAAPSPPSFLVLGVSFCTPCSGATASTPANTRGAHARTYTRLHRVRALLNITSPHARSRRLASQPLSRQIYLHRTPAHLVNVALCNIDYASIPFDGPNAGKGVPTFKALMHKSGCNKVASKRLLHVTMADIGHVDSALLSAARLAPVPTGIIVHMSERQGTPLGKLLAMQGYRVLIDPPVILQLVQSCALAQPDCDKAATHDLLRKAMSLLCASVRITQAADTGDLVYTASEFIPFPKGCFLEVQAQRAPEFEVLLTDAFPNAPWLFVYDEPVNLITEYLHKAHQSLTLPHCLQASGLHPTPSPLHCQNVDELYRNKRAGPR